MLRNVFKVNISLCLNQVLVGGTKSRFQIDIIFIITSEEELSEHHAKDQDDKSCIDVSSGEDLVARTNLQMEYTNDETRKNRKNESISLRPVIMAIVVISCKIFGDCA